MSQVFAGPAVSEVDRGEEPLYGNTGGEGI